MRCGMAMVTSPFEVTCSLGGTAGHGRSCCESRDSLSITATYNFYRCGMPVLRPHGGNAAADRIRAALKICCHRHQSGARAGTPKWLCKRDRRSRPDRCQSWWGSSGIGDAVDHSVGLVDVAGHGTWVEAGAPLAVVHAANVGDARAAVEQVLRAITM